MALNADLTHVPRGLRSDRTHAACTAHSAQRETSRFRTENKNEMDDEMPLFILHRGIVIVSAAYALQRDEIKSGKSQLITQ